LPLDTKIESYIEEMNQPLLCALRPGLYKGVDGSRKEEGERRRSVKGGGEEVGNVLSMKNWEKEAQREVADSEKGVENGEKEKAAPRKGYGQGPSISS